MSFREVSRREFARFGVAAAAAGVTPLIAKAQQPGAGRGAATSAQKPEALKSEFLMDLELETGGGGSGTVGNRSIIAVTGGTFEGPKLKGRVMSPGADWPVTAGDGLRILDVRTVLMTDDEQRIYCSYRGVVYTPPAGQGERYWRITPAFETASEKYAWLNRIVAVGVSYAVPQRVSYRIFQILCCQHREPFISGSKRGDFPLPSAKFRPSAHAHENTVLRTHARRDLCQRRSKV